MYKPGEVKVIDPPCEGMDEMGWCDEDHTHKLLGCPLEQGAKGTAYLPHSCDEWVIGGEKEIRWLIDDLWKVLRLRGIRGEEG